MEKKIDIDDDIKLALMRIILIENGELDDTPHHRSDCQRLKNWIKNNCFYFEDQDGNEYLKIKDKMKTIIFLLMTIAISINLFAQQKGEPFEGIDATWQNGNDRRDSSLFKNMKFFTPSILMDVSYTHSFNNPNDNTVVGSTAMARNNEIQLNALHFGGDFTYYNARARLISITGNYWLVPTSTR